MLLPHHVIKPERERVKGFKGHPSSPDERERENLEKVQSELLVKKLFFNPQHVFCIFTTA